MSQLESDALPDGFSRQRDVTTACGALPQKSWWACLLELNTDPATKDSQPYQCITQVLSDMSVQRSSSSSGRSFCMSTGIGS